MRTLFDIYNTFFNQKKIEASIHKELVELTKIALSARLRVSSLNNKINTLEWLGVPIKKSLFKLDEKELRSINKEPTNKAPLVKHFWLMGPLTIINCLMLPICIPGFSLALGFGLASIFCTENYLNQNKIPNPDTETYHQIYQNICKTLRELCTGKLLLQLKDNFYQFTNSDNIVIPGYSYAILPLVITTILSFVKSTPAGIATSLSLLLTQQYLKTTSRLINLPSKNELGQDLEDIKNTICQTYTWNYLKRKITSIYNSCVALGTKYSRQLNGNKKAQLPKKDYIKKQQQQRSPLRNQNNDKASELSAKISERLFSELDASELSAKISERLFSELDNYFGLFSNNRPRNVYRQSTNSYTRH